MIKEFPNGLTVVELKKIIKDWPDEGADGELTEVWIETGWCLSSVVLEVWPLNKRDEASDILFKSAAFREEIDENCCRKRRFILPRM